MRCSSLPASAALRLSFTRCCTLRRYSRFTRRLCPRKCPQVKALEQHFETQTRNLQAQLSEALLRQNEEHVRELGLQMDTPAGAYLKLC